MAIVVEFDHFLYVFTKLSQVCLQVKEKTVEIDTGRKNWWGRKIFDKSTKKEIHLSMFGQAEGTETTEWTVRYEEDDVHKARNNFDKIRQQVKKQVPNLIDEAFENTILKDQL